MVAEAVFSEEFVKHGARKVIGIDNSEAMIALANEQKLEHSEYRLTDIFIDPLPSADIINSPFVLNYAENTGELEKYVISLHEALNNNGRLKTVPIYPLNCMAS